MTKSQLLVAIHEVIVSFDAHLMRSPDNDTEI